MKNSNMSVVKDTLDIILAVCNSETGKSSLDNQPSFDNNLLELFCTSNAQIVRVCCLIYDKISTKRSHCEV